MMSRILLPLSLILGFVGVGVQGYFTINKKLSEGFDLIYSINHFYSYFTIITNSLVTFVLFFLIFFPSHKITLWFRKTTVSAAVALYILVVGIVYYALLYNSDKPFGPEVLATHILHAYMPLAYLAIWFYMLRNADLRYRDTFKWLMFPLVYFIYILIRGEIIRKYPYFFIDVEKYGYAQVIANALGVLVFFMLMGATIVFADTKIRKKN